jgi:hypothetical protein
MTAQWGSRSAKHAGRRWIRGKRKRTMKPITHDEEILVRRIVWKLYDLKIITGKEFAKICKRAERRPKKEKGHET